MREAPRHDNRPRESRSSQEPPPLQNTAGRLYPREDVREHPHFRSVLVGIGIDDCREPLPNQPRLRRYPRRRCLLPPFVSRCRRRNGDARNRGRRRRRRGRHTPHDDSRFQRCRRLITTGTAKQSSAPLLCPRGRSPAGNRTAGSRPSLEGVLMSDGNQIGQCARRRRTAQPFV